MPVGLVCGLLRTRKATRKEAKFNDTISLNCWPLTLGSLIPKCGWSKKMKCFNLATLSLYKPAAYPGIVDACEACLRLVEDEEGGEVGGVGGHDDHGEARPHHAQHAGGKAAGRSLTSTTILL
jgi:hypothetical protein